MKPGDRVLARLGGPWTDVVVLAVHPTGTISVVEADKQDSIFGDWHSVPPIDVSVGDAARWEALTGGRDLGPEDVRALLAGVGVEITAAAAEGWWKQAGEALFGDVPARRPASHVYQMFRTASWSAKALDPAAPKPEWIGLWWNQVRMGGREPGDLPAVPGVAEAAAAIGLAEEIDPEAVAALDAFEKVHGLRLPADVRELAARRGFDQAFLHAHCNNPEWQPPTAWEVVHDLRAAGLSGDVGVVAVLPHQGDHAWVLVFDDGDATATIYARHPTDGDPLYLKTAPSLAFFVWDLAESRADWQRGLAAKKI